MGKYWGKVIRYFGHLTCRAISKWRALTSPDEPKARHRRATAHNFGRNTHRTTRTNITVTPSARILVSNTHTPPRHGHPVVYSVARISNDSKDISSLNRALPRNASRSAIKLSWHFDRGQSQWHCKLSSRRVTPKSSLFLFMASVTPSE